MYRVHRNVMSATYEDFYMDINLDRFDYFDPELTRQDTP